MRAKRVRVARAGLLRVVTCDIDSATASFNPIGSGTSRTFFGASARSIAFSASTLSSPAILFADHAAPCRKTLGRMLLHLLGELRRAHQAGLHRDVSEVRGGNGLLVAICRRGETAEHGDDLDHDRRTPSLR